MIQREQWRKEFEGLKRTNRFMEFENDTFKTQDGLCFYCKKVMYEIIEGYEEHGIPGVPKMFYRYVVPHYTFDHRTPLARSGTNDLRNIVLACSGCNSRKGTKTCYEYIAELNDSFY